MGVVDMRSLLELLDDVLELGGRASAFTADSPLLGALPEFDSLAVIGLITALQERFGIEIHDEDIEPDIFETVGSLQRFVHSKRHTQGSIT